MPWHAGGSYAKFAGKEVARALGKMSMDPEDCTDKVDDLTQEQLKTLEDWETKLKAKYPVVGKVRIFTRAVSCFLMLVALSSLVEVEQEHIYILVTAKSPR